MEKLSILNLGFSRFRHHMQYNTIVSNISNPSSVPIIERLWSEQIRMVPFANKVDRNIHSRGSVSQHHTPVAQATNYRYRYITELLTHMYTARTLLLYLFSQNAVSQNLDTQ